jgi:signal transduction histidine kinase/CheY-like chemotaxis protein
MLRAYHILLLVTLLSTTSNGYGQSKYIDSLKAAALVATDTSKVNALNKLASAHWYIDPLITVRYAEESIMLATQIDFGRGLASAYNIMGAGYYQQNNYEQAINWYNKAIDQHRRNNNPVGEGHVLGNIGMIYWKQGQLGTAVEYYLKSLAIWDRLNAEDEKAGVYDNLGNVYNEQEDFDRALDYYFKARDIQKRFNTDKHFQSMTMGNIGTAYLGKREFRNALTYFFMSLEPLDPDEIESRAVSTSNIGLTYLDMKLYDSASTYLTQALTMQEKIDDSDGMLHTLIGLANCAKQAGRNAESFLLATRARDLGLSINDNTVMEQVWLMLSELSVDRGNHKDAYEYYVKYVAARDSIKNKENIYKIAHLQAGFETQKKQAQIETMQKEQRQLAFRRNTILAGVSALLVIAMLVASIQRLKIKKNNQLLAANSELKLQSQKLEQQTLKLQELDRVKSTFFANISHEFRTPLTLILNSLSDRINTVKESGHAADLEQLEVMNRNGKRLLNLINQLLDLSKLDAGKMRFSPEACDLNQLLTTTHASFSSLAFSRKISFHLALPQEPVICMIDIDKMEKIIYNLLSNAFKFTPIGGDIRLEASTTGSTISIIVHDSGPGIPDEQLNKIFDRFYQVQQYYTDEQGTGIGLALTKELAELHSGKVMAENTPGGAKFIVELPLVTPDKKLVEHEFNESSLAHIVVISPPAESSSSEFTSAGENRTTILVVEDSIDLRNYMAKTLGNEFDVIVAENGRQGFDSAVARMPDLVISDWMMPEMDGVTLCRNLKADERTSHIPVIILTALATDDAKLQGLEMGADDYLTKPFDSRELITRARNLIHSRSILREKFSRELRLAPRQVQVSSMDEKFIQKVMETIEMYMGEPDFDMEKFGQQVGLSRMQLHRKLKAITGHSPGDFLRIMRLKRAKQLLEAKSGNVSEVAYEVGFNNLSYFSKCYREEYKISPNETFSADVTKVQKNVTH